FRSVGLRITAPVMRARPSVGREIDRRPRRTLRPPPLALPIKPTITQQICFCPRGWWRSAAATVDRAHSEGALVAVQGDGACVVPDLLVEVVVGVHDHEGAIGVATDDDGGVGALSDLDDVALGEG